MILGDVAIVGGGVIGMSIARVLSREGVKVALLDRGALGKCASWAGAGLIPPYRTRVIGDPLAELRSWSALLHEEWARSLLEETGVDNGYRRTGGVDLALDESDASILEASIPIWRAEGIRHERLDRASAAEFEPTLVREFREAIALPDRAQIRNPRHLRALEASLSRSGVSLRPGTAVLDVAVRGGRVRGVVTEQGKLACDRVVITAGAWSGGFLARLGVNAPTPPIKGQIVLLRADKSPPRRVVEHGKYYLVPRDDGRVLVGATEESVGFDVAPEAGGVRDLLNEAFRICPSLAEAEFEKTWAGLRPGSRDGAPYIAAVAGIDGLFAVTGHQRAGIQLAPGTAEVASDLILERRPRIDLSRFRIERPDGTADDLAHRS